MDDCDAALAHATHEIAAMLLTTAYLRLPAPQKKSGASCKRCLGCPKVQDRSAIVEGVASS
jgi:hypothetical protein